MSPFKTQRAETGARLGLVTPILRACDRSFRSCSRPRCGWQSVLTGTLGSGLNDPTVKLYVRTQLRNRDPRLCRARGKLLSEFDRYPQWNPFIRSRKPRAT